MSAPRLDHRLRNALDRLAVAAEDVAAGRSADTAACARACADAYALMQERGWSARRAHLFCRGVALRRIPVGDEAHSLRRDHVAVCIAQAVLAAQVEAAPARRREDVARIAS